MHFYRSGDKNLQPSLLFSRLDLHEGNGPLRGTLAVDTSLAFAQSLIPCLIYQSQQAEAACHPLRRGIFGSIQQTSLPSRAVWRRGPFARSIDEIHLKHHCEEETGQRFVQMYCCGLCESVCFLESDHRCRQGMTMVLKITYCHSMPAITEGKLLGLVER